MSYRYMRILLFFDLPTTTLADKKNYRDFRKLLISNGFLMLQESVYCKLALNQTIVNSIMNTLKKNKPSSGNIQALCVTEKQFAKMEFIVGSKTSDTINSVERLIVL